MSAVRLLCKQNIEIWKQQRSAQLAPSPRDATSPALRISQDRPLAIVPTPTASPASFPRILPSVLPPNLPRRSPPTH